MCCRTHAHTDTHCDFYFGIYNIVLYVTYINDSASRRRIHLTCCAPLWTTIPSVVVDQGSLAQHLLS